MTGANRRNTPSTPVGTAKFAAVLPSALAGLAFGLSLIVAIGAQNAYVLRQGLRREHVGVVVAICTLSDIALIALGTAGVGALISRNTVLLTAITLAGVAVLLWYAVTAVRRALRPHALVAERLGEPSTLLAAAMTALALTWLNPHVYLDTVILLGSVAATQPFPWVFAVGAMAGSLIWFVALGFGAQALSPLFARPTAWRVFDLVVAAVMTIAAGGLLLNLPR